MGKTPDPDKPVGRPRKAAVAPGLALWSHDQGLLAEFPVLGGVDEVGRGPFAGNVVAACVILDLSRPPIEALNDSKKVKSETRDLLYDEIRATAVAYGIGESTPEEIDRVNILQATFLAMRRALAAMTRDPGLLLVDGNQLIPEVQLPQRCLVKGDGLSASIAAASILAKVTRDRQMADLHRLHPEYGFDSHKGYGTAQHREAIARFGLTPFHRRSFCHEEARQESLFGA